MTYKTVDEAYNKEFNNLVGIAKSKLVNPDYAIDCIHDVFSKLLEVRQYRNGESNISGYILARHVTRHAILMNKKLIYTNTKEISYDVQDDGRGVRESDTEATFDSENTFE